MSLLPKTAPAGSGIGNVADLISSLSNVSQLFTGKSQTTKTSGGTQTTGLDISQEGVNKMIQDILEGNSGLASVSSGQKGAGIYNSTTQSQLANDLITRATGEVAAKTAKQVTTTSPTSTTTKVDPSLDIGNTLLTVGGGALAKKLYDKLGVGAAVDGAVGSAADTISSIFSGSGNIGSSAGLASAASEGVADFLGGRGFTNYSGVADLAGDLLGDGAGSYISSFMPSLGGGSLDSFGAGGIPYFDIASGLLQGKDVEDVAANAAVNYAAYYFGGPIGSAVAQTEVGAGFTEAASDLLGGFTDALGSVICTQLRNTGKMSAKIYAADVAYARNNLSETTLNGYRVWGIPAVRLMRKYPAVSNFLGYFALNRARYIAGEYNLVGHLVNLIGVPVCNLIGRFISTPDYSVLYSKGV